MKTFFKLVQKSIQQITSHLLLEIFIYGMPIISVYFLTSWGVPVVLAWILAILITIALLIAIATVLSILGSMFNELSGFTSSKRSYSKVRLASSIAKILTNSSSSEWHEYQDWLHDILLARRQLIDAKCPRWKVAVITHWRLSILCIVVGANKIGRLASRFLRLG